MSRVLMNDFARQWADVREDSVAAFEQFGAGGWYILGKQVRAFEQALAREWGVAHAVGVASGLDAIEIALRLLHCGPGERVLTTPLSAFATTLAILKTGATPVFVDTDASGLIDLDRCAELLSTRSDIRYFVPVHLYGQSLDPDKLRKLQRRFDLRMVEDCAQSIGASSRGTPTGLAGQAAAVSFYPTKNLGAMGDAGVILTASPDLAARAAHLRDYGQSEKYRHSEIGYNSRLDELHAALLLAASLPRLAGWTARRREVAARYHAGLTNPAIQPLPQPLDSCSCWHLFPVLVDPSRKTAFQRHLDSHDIAWGEHYPLLIPSQPAMNAASFAVEGNLVHATRIAAGEISLPIHPYLTSDEIDRVIAACNSWN